MIAVIIELVTPGTVTLFILARFALHQPNTVQSTTNPNEIKFYASHRTKNLLN